MMFSLLTFTLMAAASGPAGQIAFVSGSSPQDRAVYVLDLAAKEATRVGTGAGDGAPVWSPDGTWLAFSTQRGDGRGIHVVRADGTDGYDIPHAAAWNVDPAWSKDGARLAYGAGTGLQQRIVVYDIASGEETPWGGDRPGLMRPVWLDPKALFALLMLQEELGKDIPKDIIESGTQSGAVFAIAALPSAQGLTTDIAVVTQAGWFTLPPSMLPSANGAYAEWNVEPDAKGRRYAFESNDGGDREIFTVSRSGAVDVTNHRAADWNPRWSPDSKWIAFESFRGGRRGVYRVYRDSTRVYPVAAWDDADAWAPSWSPDAEWIACVSTRFGAPRITVVSVDGKTVIQASDQGGEDLAPAWRPGAATEGEDE